MGTDKNEKDDSFDELEELFGGGESDLAKTEKIMLTQHLEGFASCFPEWDLHPPVSIRS